MNEISSGKFAGVDVREIDSTELGFMVGAGWRNLTSEQDRIAARAELRQRREREKERIRQRFRRSRLRWQRRTEWQRVTLEAAEPAE